MNWHGTSYIIPALVVLVAWGSFVIAVAWGS